MKHKHQKYKYSCSLWRGNRTIEWSCKKQNVQNLHTVHNRIIDQKFNGYILQFSQKRFSTYST